MLQSSPHQTVVVGVDGTAASAAAVRWAAAEAARRGARLHAVHVIEHGECEYLRHPRDVRLELESARQTVPHRVAAWVWAEGLDLDIAVSVVTGDVAHQLAREAGDAALVVIGAPGSLHHTALPADLALGCLCPIAVVGALGDVAYVDIPVHSSTKGASHARP